MSEGFNKKNISEKKVGGLEWTGEMTKDLFQKISQQISLIKETDTANFVGMNQAIIIAVDRLFYNLGDGVRMGICDKYKSYKERLGMSDWKKLAAGDDPKKY